jgi:tetratricopeptide (TPR) repeat protein
MAAAAAASGENKPKQANEAFQEARQVCQQHGLAAEEAIVVMAIGNTHVATNQLDLAIQHYEESVAVARKGDVPVVRAQAGLALGSTLFRKQEYERAGKAYEQAGEDAKDCESDILYIDALRMAGTCHNLRQKPDEAMRCWKDALQTSQHISPAELQLSTWEQVGQAFLELCRKRGLGEQAKSVASQIEALRRQATAFPAVAH